VYLICNGLPPISGGKEINPPIRQTGVEDKM
jgi:hypothetical protein